MACRLHLPANPARLVDLDRREKPNSGARPHPARPAAQTRKMRDHDPRLQSQRHDHPVRGARHSSRNRHRALHEAAPTSGVHPLPRRRRTRRSCRESHPHTILDSCATYKHPAVLKWLADHPRWTFHFTPTSASWLNAIERLFSTITRRKIHRGVFKSVPHLAAEIARYIARSTTNPRNPSSGQSPQRPFSTSSPIFLNLPFEPVH